jgi:hypothetical protein
MHRSALHCVDPGPPHATPNSPLPQRYSLGVVAFGLSLVAGRAVFKGQQNLLIMTAWALRVTAAFTFVIVTFDGDVLRQIHNSCESGSNVGRPCLVGLTRTPLSHCDAAVYVECAAVVVYYVGAAIIGKRGEQIAEALAAARAPPAGVASPTQARPTAYSALP